MQQEAVGVRQIVRVILYPFLPLSLLFYEYLFVKSVSHIHSLAVSVSFTHRIQYICQNRIDNEKRRQTRLFFLMQTPFFLVYKNVIL